MAWVDDNYIPSANRLGYGLSPNGVLVRRGRRVDNFFHNPFLYYLRSESDNKARSARKSNINRIIYFCAVKRY